LNEFGVVMNKFKQNMKIKSFKNWLLRYKKTTKQNRKKLWSVLSCWKEWDVHREEKMRKVNIHKKYTQNYKILEFTEFCSG